MSNFGQDPPWNNYAFNQDGGYDNTEWVGMNTLNVVATNGWLGHPNAGAQPAVCAPSAPAPASGDGGINAADAGAMSDAQPVDMGPLADAALDAGSSLDGGVTDAGPTNTAGSRRPLRGAPSMAA
jgi:hypothetical protein